MSRPSAPVRVAVVAPRYTEVGGMQNYARRVTSWLRDTPGVEPVVISTRPGLRRDETELDGVRVIRLGTWLTLSNTPVNPLWALQLWWLLRRLRITVVNAHSPVPVLADLAVAVAGRRRRTVLTYHSGSLVKGTGGVVDAVLRAYERHVLPRVFRRADSLVAVSPVASTVHSGRAETIPPGVDTALFHPATDARARAAVYVGRIERTSAWKGLPVLLDAFAAADVPGASLEIVGDGDALPDLQRRAAELGVADRVRWHGALPQDDVARVLRGARVAVLPSLTESESFGMSLIEAMASGTAVIGSHVGGIPHVVRDGVDGLLVPPGDVPALAAALTRVLTDDELAARLGSAGRRATEDTWDWRHQRERTLALLTRPERRPRLAAVTDAVAPWSTGGKEQRQHELYTRLAARGVQVDVFTMKWWDGPERSVERDGVRFHALCRLVPLYTDGRRSIAQGVVFALATLRMLTRPFDVLEVDAIPFLPLYPARLVAWLRRRPMTTTWHEYWGADYWTEYLGDTGGAQAVAGRLAGAVERAAIRLPDRIVAASEGTAERLREVRSGLDVRVVTPGIGADVLARGGAAATPSDVGDRPVRLVSAGRLLDHKKVDVAIRSVAVSAARGVPVRLTVIGQGPAAADLRALVDELGLADRVDFLAFLPEHADVLAAMAAADLVAFPSVREGFGMVALEAMAMGTPVITSDHPDNFARHLVDPGVNGERCAAEPEAFADAVQRCLPHLDRLAAGALATARAFEWERIADKAYAAYVELTPSARG